MITMRWRLSTERAGLGNGSVGIPTFLRWQLHYIENARHFDRWFGTKTTVRPLWPRAGDFALVPELSRPASTHLMWDARVDSSVLSCSAERAAVGDPDTFSLSHCTLTSTVIIGISGIEHLAISDGFQRVRLDVVDGTLLDGPVRLHYCLRGLSEAAPKLITLQRLIALDRLGRFSRELRRQEPKVERWTMMLRAHDLAVQGATQREIALHLFGPGAAADWRARSDSLRLRVQRLLRDSFAMVGGGYQELFQG